MFTLTACAEPAVLISMSVVHKWPKMLGESEHEHADELQLLSSSRHVINEFAKLRRGSGSQAPSAASDSSIAEPTPKEASAASEFLDAEQHAFITEAASAGTNARLREQLASFSLSKSSFGSTFEKRAAVVKVGCERAVLRAHVAFCSRCSVLSKLASTLKTH